MKVMNKNKSRNGELHKCDHCGKNPEGEIYMSCMFDGQYCKEHFEELMNED